jgi:biopolymer transport protein ExbD
MIMSMIIFIIIIFIIIIIPIWQSPEIVQINLTLAIKQPTSNRVRQTILLWIKKKSSLLIENKLFAIS